MTEISRDPWGCLDQIREEFSKAEGAAAAAEELLEHLRIERGELEIRRDQAVAELRSHKGLKLRVGAAETYRLDPKVVEMDQELCRLEAQIKRLEASLYRLSDMRKQLTGEMAFARTILGSGG
jgi:chromosome segregation ATPase